MSEKKSRPIVFEAAHFPKGRPPSRMTVTKADSGGLFFTVAKAREGAEGSEDWTFNTVLLNEGEVAQLLVSLVRYVLRGGSDG
jgi:hypothetical protein